MSTITCPECGKELQVNDPSRSFIFCRHCGTKIAVDAFRSTHASCNSQDPIITPPPKSSWNPNEKSDASAEELRHQHELEMERLRYEHELELERLRHQNEMEREWMKHEYADAAEKAEPAEPADEAPSYDSSRKKGTHSSENKTLGWRIGHFCGKHPFWTIIIVLVVFQAIFGGSSTKTSSPVSSVSSSSKTIQASSANYSTAYTHTTSSGTVYYFLFDQDTNTVCFLDSKTDRADVASYVGSGFATDTGVDSVFYYSDGAIHRNFIYKESSDDSVLTITEYSGSETPHTLSFEKADLAAATSALNEKRIYRAMLSR